MIDDILKEISEMKQENLVLLVSQLKQRAEFSELVHIIENEFIYQ